MFDMNLRFFKGTIELLNRPSGINLFVDESPHNLWSVLGTGPIGMVH